MNILELCDDILLTIKGHVATKQIEMMSDCIAGLPPFSWCILGRRKYYLENHCMFDSMFDNPPPSTCTEDYDDSPTNLPKNYFNNYHRLIINNQIFRKNHTINNRICRKNHIINQPGRTNCTQRIQ